MHFIEIFLFHLFNTESLSAAVYVKKDEKKKTPDEMGFESSHSRQCQLYAKNNIQISDLMARQLKTCPPSSVPESTCTLLILALIVLSGNSTFYFSSAVRSVSLEP